MRFRRTSAFLTALIGTALMAALPALAERTAFRYDTAQRVINACVLAVDVDTDPAPDATDYQAAHPYLIEGMRRSALKPDDWVFENPLAEPTVVEGDAPADYVLKGKASYWVVELTPESAKRLVGMDLIYLSASVLDLDPNTSEGRRMRDGLRAAVEAGAVLWVDNAIERNAGGDPTDATEVVNFPWLAPDVFDFDDSNNNILRAVDSRNGLLNEPHSIGRAAVTRLGARPDRDEYDQWQATQPDSALTEGHFLDDEFFSPSFRTIIENVAFDDDGNQAGAAPWAIAMDYGAGTVLVTTGGVGTDVVEWTFEGGTGGGWRPSPNFLQAPDVKLALNCVQWSERWQQARRTARASAASVSRAPFPLDIFWQYPDATDGFSIGAVVSTPVHDRNIVYAVSIPTSPAVADVPGYLMAFDMTPEEDRDGDNMPDDGPVTDYADGTPYDMLWEVQLAEDMHPRYASATVTSYTDPGSNLSDTADDVLHPQVVLVSYVDTANGVGWVDCYDGSVGGGTLLWRREIEAFDPADGAVVALSTPVVHNGYVYVLASEFDPTLTPAGPPSPNDTYGRVHCFEVDYPWTDADAWPTDASWWAYPANLDDIDGVGAPATPGPTEPQKALAPFHDPFWVAAEPTRYPGGRTPLPPAPGSIPVVHGAGSSVDGTGADALVTVGTPVSFELTGGNIRIDNNLGGTQYTLVPTPFREDNEEPAKPGLGSVNRPWGIGLNHDYYALRLNEAISTPPDPSVETAAGDNVDQLDWADGERYVRVSPASAREAAIYAVAAGANPLEAQLGVDVNVTYEDVDGDTHADEAHLLAGPVRWKRVLDRGESINQPASTNAEEMAVGASRPINYTYLTPPPNPPTASGSVSELAAPGGETQWTYDPSVSMPGRTANALGAGTTAAAFDDETVIVGTSAVDYAAAGTGNALVSSIVGLRRQMDVDVTLNPPTPGQFPERVYLVRPGATAGTPQIDEIAPGAYDIDPWGGRLSFSASSAADIIDADGYALGVPVYGNAIQVQWDEAGTVFEDHMVPDIERFHHTPGFIRLSYRPYAENTVVIRRTDGSVIPDTDWDPISNPVDFRGRSDAILDGWIDLRNAAVDEGEELLVEYAGWSENDLTWVDVPNPTLNVATERHQVPVEFGYSMSGPAIAGDTIHLGTQGRDRNLDNDFDPDPLNPGDPEPAPDRETLLSLIWNRATGFLRSGKIEPARRQTGIDGVPVVSGSPSVADDNVFVGSRMMSRPARTEIGPGYVSSLVPWRVMLCDTSRIVETTGSEPSWVCTGTSSPQAAQDFIGEDLQRPFSRPAMATRLQTGNILVVDSGNHRVVEIDGAGRMVWPLDMNGYEYYTSPNNNDLRLSRPADAYRYYEVEPAPNTPGRYFPVLHTIVADTGNARVIDIETRFYNPETEVQDGRQRHTINVLTPTYVRAAGGAKRVRYTSATPITDPDTSAITGYLCAASNLNQLLVVTVSDQTPIVNPYAGVATVGGAANSTWQHWAWLYDADPTDADDVSNQPLRFENIKHVDVQRFGDTIHVAVTCTRYRGREGETAHPLADNGAGVFEFRIDVSSNDPTQWELAGLSGGWETDDPHWYFCDRNYKFSKSDPALDPDVPRPMTTIITDAGEYRKRWYPVCSQRLSTDRVLITNSLSQIDNATYENMGAGVRDAVLGSHIFEVVTNDQDDADPRNDQYFIDPDRSVPEPGEMWADPFTQPAHAVISR